MSLYLIIILIIFVFIECMCIKLLIVVWKKNITQHDVCWSFLKTNSSSGPLPKKQRPMYVGISFILHHICLIIEEFGYDCILIITVIFKMNELLTI